MRDTLKRGPKRSAPLWGALVVVGAMALAGCGGGEPKSAPSPSSAPPSASASAAPSPKEGACYNLTYDEALAPTAGGTAVSCKGKHTTQTYAVGRLRNVVDGHLIAVDSEQVAAQVAEACPNKVTKYLGGDADDLRLSMLRPVWFTPTIKESEAGANWFRCDVIGIAGPNALMTLKGNMKGVLGDSDTAEPFRMCGTASPKSESFKRVPCSLKHTWRALSVIDLGSGKYPGEAKVNSAGAEDCKAAAAEVADDPLKYEWSWEFPSAEQWQGGQTYGICWAPS
ncbi:septum formation family protein [Nocardioides sp. NPDC004968]|uniref:septum formation family protein n=1 Tax=Nocardioides sp. NPDC004968 TaxID=3155894 RepID=UPI0033B1E4A7